MFVDFSSSSQFLCPSVTSCMICFSISAWNLSSHFHGFHHANYNDKQIYSFISHQYLICISQSTSNSICPKVNLLISLPKLSFFTFLPSLMLDQGTYHLFSNSVILYSKSPSLSTFCSWGHQFLLMLPLSFYSISSCEDAPSWLNYHHLLPVLLQQTKRSSCLQFACFPVYPLCCH